MVWDLNQLRNDVQALYGVEQRDQVAPALNSIVDRQAFARFHYQEAIRLITELLNDRDKESILFDLVFGADRNAHHEFSNCRKFAEAHITACVQSLHSVSDIMAHAIYYSLGLNLDAATKCSPNRISLHVVKSLLPDSETSALIKELCGHAEYRYLADMANHSKHRSVVQTPYSVDATGEDVQPHGLKFAAFTYDNRTYPARWVTPVLEAEYNRQSSLVTQIGESLNARVKRG